MPETARLVPSGARITVARSECPKPHAWSLATGCRAPSRRDRLLDLLEHAQQLAHAAHEQPLLVDLHPRPRRGREDHVVARLDGHRDVRALPPVQPGPDGEHDPVLRRRLMGTGGDEQAGLADPVRLELLDDDAIEEGAKVLAHDLRTEPMKTARASSAPGRLRPARGGCRSGRGSRTGWRAGRRARPVPERP